LLLKPQISSKLLFLVMQQSQPVSKYILSFVLFPCSDLKAEHKTWCGRHVGSYQRR